MDRVHKAVARKNTRREVAKRTVRALCIVLVWPLFLVFRVSAKISAEDRAFASFSQWLSLVPGAIGVYLRAAGLSTWNRSISQDVSIGFLTVLAQSDIRIGESVYIGSQCNIGRCSIGRDCLFGSGVHVLSGNRQHGTVDLDRPWREQPGEFRQVRIGENCWIGNHATILDDIGPGSIVAAGAVVTTAVPSGVVVAGNPARVLRTTRELVERDQSRSRGARPR